MTSALHDIRKARKVALSELGQAVQITKGQLSRIERGESRPSAKTAERIFEFFGGAITREQLMFPETPVTDKKPARSARPMVAQ